YFFSSRRRHTRCYRDWSSDVCSSDLLEWEDQVDAEHVLLREHQARIDDKDLVLPFERPHVDADLAEASERQVTKPRTASRGPRRSEERRVGKESTQRWPTAAYKRNKV